MPLALRDGRGQRRDQQITGAIRRLPALIADPQQVLTGGGILAG